MPERVKSLEDALTRVFSIVEASYISGEYEDEPPFYVLFSDGALLANSENEPRLLCPWRHNYEKPVYVTATRMVAEEYEVDMFVFVSEAWASRRKRDELDSMPLDDRGMPEIEIPPSKDPNRVEVLTLFAGEKSGRRISQMYEMMRDDVGALTGFRLYESFDSEEKGAQILSRQDIWNDENLLDSIRRP